MQFWISIQCVLSNIERKQALTKKIETQSLVSWNLSSGQLCQLAIGSKKQDFIANLALFKI